MQEEVDRVVFGDASRGGERNRVDPDDLPVVRGAHERFQRADEIVVTGKARADPPQLVREQRFVSYRDDGRAPVGKPGAGAGVATVARAPKARQRAAAGAPRSPPELPRARRQDRIAAMPSDLRCIRCGTGNRAQRQFCAECGARLPVACPACGFGNEATERFCGGCGTRLRSGGARGRPPRASPGSRGCERFRPGRPRAATASGGRSPSSSPISSTTRGCRARSTPRTCIRCSNGSTPSRTRSWSASAAASTSTSATR